MNGIAVPNLRLRLTRVVKLAVAFSAGQIALQAMTAVTGLCLVRWLSVQDYAKLAFSLSFQASLGLIIDLGVTNAIIALVADQHSNPAVLGQYMRAGFSLRTRFLVIALTLGGITFLALSARQGWSSSSMAAALGTLVLGLMSQFSATLYGVPLVLRRRLGIYYGVQAGSGALRFALILALQSVHVLTILPAFASGAISTACTAFLFKRFAKSYYHLSTEIDKHIKRNIIKYISPLAPGIAFLALQSQTTLLLVSYFAGAKTIAEVGALGRLGQLFALLSAFNGVIVGPQFARLTPDRIKPLYFQTAGMATAIATAGACVVSLWPSSLLWLLGPKYSGLSRSLIYVAAASGLSYLSSVLWSIHSARKWIYWWSTWLYIGLVLTIQVAGVCLLNVGSTLGASKLTFLTASTILFVHVVVGLYSLTRPLPHSDLQLA